MRLKGMVSEIGSDCDFKGRRLDLRGNFGCPSPETDWVMEITRFTAKDKSELLIAKWIQRDIGRGGYSIFRLWPRIREEP
jgi:hypothetical protein